MLWLDKNVCIARNSIWRRRQKEYHYNFATVLRTLRDEDYDEIMTLEHRNFWDRG